MVIVIEQRLNRSFPREAGVFFFCFGRGVHPCYQEPRHLIGVRAMRSKTYEV